MRLVVLETTSFVRHLDFDPPYSNYTNKKRPETKRHPEHVCVFNPCSITPCFLLHLPSPACSFSFPQKKPPSYPQPRSVNSLNEYCTATPTTPLLMLLCHYVIPDKLLFTSCFVLVFFLMLVKSSSIGMYVLRSFFIIFFSFSFLTFACFALSCLFKNVA